jgi:hypothetical protein
VGAFDRFIPSNEQLSEVCIAEHSAEAVSRLFKDFGPVGDKE